jgi:carbonic anhydrase/acetyltransferase-like protein (isoleucine patch superfamily)
MPLRPFEGSAPAIDRTAFVDSTALIIGNVSAGPDSSFWPFVVVRGDIHRITIGARSNIQDGTVIHVTHDGPFNPRGFGTTIGNDVTVGHKVMLHGCTIADRALIGMGAIIMDGATVESEVVVGAGSLVPPGKILTSGYLYVGSPVKQIRRLTEKELTYFSYSAQRYVELKDRHLLSLSAS